MIEIVHGWEEDQIHVEVLDKTVPCWYFSTPTSYRKWRVVGYPDGPVQIKLGLIGPRWEEHGKRYWALVWKARDLNEAKLFVERQENPPAFVRGSNDGGTHEGP